MNVLLKKGLALAVLLTLIVIIANWPLIAYLIGQGKGQFKVLNQAIPIEEFLEKPNLDTGLKDKILLIKQVKEFCSQELGMEPGEKYTTIYDQKGEDILWNLTACEPYALVSKEWSFPIVGNVSYKGFFDLELAKKEEQGASPSSSYMK